MLGAAKNGVVNAMVKCRARSLLSTPQFQRLLDATTPDEQIGVLQELGIPLPTDGSSLTGQFLITNWLVPDYEATFRRVSGGRQELLRTLLARLELENIKYVLRCVVGRKPVEIHALLDLGRVSTVPVQILGKVRGMGDFLKAIERTPFSGPVHELATHKDLSGSLFRAELTFDQAVYVSLWSQAQKTHEFSTDGAQLLLEKLSQVLFLLWIIRYRQSYESSKELVLGISQGAQPFPRAVLSQVVQTTSFADLSREMVASPKLKKWAKGETLATWEVWLWKRIVQAAKKALYGPPFDLGVTVGFLLLKELMIRDVSLICQSMVLEVPRADILPFLTFADLSGRT